MKKKAKILIVEDESIIAQDLQMILENLGYDVPATTDSGELAIQKTGEINPDLILMDIRLIGEMDGITAAQRILKQFDIPIIFLTAHSDEATLARAKVATPFGYIIKPFKERELHTNLEIAIYKHRMERRLKENEQWLNTVLQSIGDGVIATDPKGYITFINPVAEQITGWSFQEAVGKDVEEVFKIINEITRKNINNLFVKVIQTGKVSYLSKPTLLLRKDGKEIPIEDSISPIVKEKSTALPQEREIIGAVLVFKDVTQQKIAAEKLHRQANYDALTNLSNRVWFKERLIDAVERVKRNSNYLFAVLFLDLDRFKIINDSYGHTVGDRMLVEVAQRLEKSVRSIDTVARLGGDEFAILLENIQNDNEACRIAERIQEKLSLPFNLNGKEVFANASIGIVLSSIGYEQVEELIRDADIAMYQAKARGKGCYQVFNTVVRDRVLATSQLENDLRQAIERNELVVYYQPIVSLATMETNGFEALVRWNHPEGRMISPAQFIPIAEATGLIVQIDRWVFQEACRQMKVWQEQLKNLSLYISVNLSSKQFLQLNFVEQMKKILDETGIEPSSLKLEITESVIIENPESAAAILTELKASGIVLSLDDFGTGYSSLNYLQQFPFDILKIDRCFIRNLDKNQKNATISKALIQIAHQLNLKVTAEGVETEAELAFLKENQCDEVQGYLFSRPLPAAEVQKILWRDRHIY